MYLTASVYTCVISRPWGTTTKIMSPMRNVCDYTWVIHMFELLETSEWWWVSLVSLDCQNPKILWNFTYHFLLSKTMCVSRVGTLCWILTVYFNFLVNPSTRIGTVDYILFSLFFLWSKQEISYTFEWWLQLHGRLNIFICETVIF